MQIQGKTLVFLGDSITEGAGVANIAENRFDSRIGRRYGAKTVNYGIGGTRLAHQHKASAVPRYDLCFCGRAFDLDKDADCIIVFGGTNDYGHGDADFGAFQDETPDTYCGAVRFLMRTLGELYPNAKTVFLTPARREGGTEPIPTGSADKRPLAEYAEAICRIGAEEEVPVLDLYTRLGIDPDDPAQKARFTADGLHLNDEGHAVLADLLAGFLEEL